MEIRGRTWVKAGETKEAERALRLASLLPGRVCSGRGPGEGPVSQVGLQDPGRRHHRAAPRGSGRDVHKCPSSLRRAARAHEETAPKAEREPPEEQGKHCPSEGVELRGGGRGEATGAGETAAVGSRLGRVAIGCPVSSSEVDFMLEGDTPAASAQIIMFWLSFYCHTRVNQIQT